MQLPLFYEPLLTEKDTLFLLSEESKRHAINVLRLKTSDAFHVTNGKGLLCRAVLQEVDKKNAVAKIETIQFVSKPTTEIIIAVSLVKNSSRFEWLLEKITELGVAHIIPLLCKRTEKEHFRYDRMNAIVVAAMLQSQQTWLPQLHNPTSFNDLVSKHNYKQKFAAFCGDIPKNDLSRISITENAIILIGPEGDFTNEEMEKAIEKNYLPVTLGKTRLRTETAAIVAATLLINNIEL